MAIVDDDDRVGRVAGQDLNIFGARDKCGVMDVGRRIVARCNCNGKAGELKEEEETEHGRGMVGLRR